MAINIVKKENNDNVFFYDSGTGDLINSYTNKIISVAYNTSEVRINFSSGYLIVKRSEINSTQVEPDAAVPFSGSSEALAELLSESFFK